MALYPFENLFEFSDLSPEIIYLHTYPPLIKSESSKTKPRIGLTTDAGFLLWSGLGVGSITAYQNMPKDLLTQS